jgi:hypothetical protein
MKKRTPASVALAFLFSASTANSGGPVVILDEQKVVAEKPRSGLLLPLVLVGVVLCVMLCGGEDGPSGVAG